MPLESSSSESSRRKRLGELAVEKGLLTAAQLEEALRDQKKLEKLGVNEKLGTILYKKKWLTKQSVQEMLKDQQLSNRRLGNFEVGERLGSGAMGVVFKARQISMDRTVALKILAPKYSGDPVFIDRFVKEARAAGQFSHENIVSALDVGFAEPYHYFAMEYVEGENLRQRLKRGKLPEKEALDVAMQTAQALEHALAKKMIHRDVKPDNLIKAKDGVVKLLDMGLACVIGAEDDEAEENKGSEKKALGTPLYISPEAARGQSDLDTRTDIYSLGCTLYHLLTGKPPFEGRSREVMELHVSTDVPDVRAFDAKLSKAASQIVSKMTKRDRDERYPSPSELIEDLEDVLEGKAPRHATGKRSETTTGPRAPISGKGTTGPRAPIRPKNVTTGPRTAVHVKITSQSDPIGVTGKSGRAEAEKKNNVGMIVGFSVGAVVLLGLGAFMLTRGNNEESAKKPETHEKPAPEPPKTPREPVKQQEIKKPTQPALSKEEQAKQGFDELQRALKEQPNDFLALFGALDRAATQTADMPQSAQVAEIRKAVQARFDEAIANALKVAEEKAKQAFDKGDYTTAFAALEDDQWPANLKLGDWQARLGGLKKTLGDGVEGIASKILQDARALAQPGTSAALTAALAAVEKAVALPAPSGKAAQEEKEKWTAALDAAKKTEDAAKLAQAEKSREVMAKLRKELDPLIRQNLNAALELIEKRLGEKEYALAKDELLREKADILAIKELRQQVGDAIKKRTGETVTLRQGKEAFTGAITPNQPAASINLRVQDGFERGVSVERLDYRDVEANAPKELTANMGELLRRLGLLAMSQAEYGAAKTYFGLAKEKGAKVDEYLERLEVLALGEAEVKARQQWSAAEALFEAKKYKEAKSAYETFQAESGKTNYAAQQQTLLKTRLTAIDTAINPLQPGLAGTFYNGAEFKGDALLSRVDAKLDFDWSGNPPAKEVPHDNYCVRYTGSIKIDKGGHYTFGTIADDGTRLWVNGKMVVDDWNLHGADRRAGEIDLAPGIYDIKVEFFQGGGGAVLKLIWGLKDGFNEGIVPAEVLFHDPKGAPSPEKKDAPAPAPPKTGDKATLQELPEQDVQVGFGNLGKGGDLGYDDKKVTFNGQEVKNALSMHPPTNGAAHVAYMLGKQFKNFAGAAALNDDAKSARTALNFKILGDGKVIWQSNPLKKSHEGQAFNISVSGIDKLELIVECPGDHTAAHAVWLDPVLSK